MRSRLRGSLGSPGSLSDFQFGWNRADHDHVMTYWDDLHESIMVDIISLCAVSLLELYGTMDPFNPFTKR